MSVTKYLRRGLSYIIYGIPNVEVRPEIFVSSPTNALHNKRIIVTGGGSGLGFAMAKKFSSEGAKVLITGRNITTLAKAAQEIGCDFKKLDITHPETFDNFITDADSILGGIDCLVNNAGISLHESSLFEVTVETFDKQINTNFRGPYFLSQSFAKYLFDNHKKGNILFISSETGETMDIRPYGFSKAAINSMVQGLAYLFKKDGIRVNAIAPGITASEMTGIDGKGNLYAGSYGSGRFYLPAEIAEVACFFLSDFSKSISGQIITCNNAQTINARWK